MRIVRFGSTKLIIRNCLSGAGGCWATGKILQLTTPSHIPNEDIEFAIRPEGKDTAIMIATRGLSLVTLARRFRCSIILERAQLDQIEIKGQALTIPDETVDTIAQQGYCQYITIVRAKLRCISTLFLRGEERSFSWRRRCNTAPIQVDKMIRCKIRVKSDTQ